MSSSTGAASQSKGMKIARLAEPAPRFSRTTQCEPNTQDAAKGSEGMAKDGNPDRDAGPITNFHLLIYSIYAAGLSLIIGLAVAEFVPTRWSPSAVWFVTTIGVAVLGIFLAVPILRRFVQWRADS